MVSIYKNLLQGKKNDRYKWCRCWHWQGLHDYRRCCLNSLGRDCFCPPQYSGSPSALDPSFLTPIRLLCSITKVFQSSSLIFPYHNLVLVRKPVASYSPVTSSGLPLQTRNHSSTVVFLFPLSLRSFLLLASAQVDIVINIKFESL